METDKILLLDLDEQNLAQFLSAVALTALARRVPIEGSGIEIIESRRCWWPKPGEFAIQSELPAMQFRSLLFAVANNFLKGLRWVQGLGGAAHGLLVSNNEIGVNPFVSLFGDANESTPLKTFSAKVQPCTILPRQLAKLQAPHSSLDWLNQLEHGAGSWGFDHRVNLHASDAGISSDAEKTGHLDPFYPAVELLGLASAAFFVPSHAWQVERNSIVASAWTQRIPLSLAALAATVRVHGLPARKYKFSYRGAAHGKGGAYHFFPPARTQLSTT